MNVEKPRRNKRASACTGCGRALAQQFDFQAAFLQGFAKGSLLRILIELDMPA